MNKLLLLSLLSVFALSCNNVEKDANTIAEFKCISFDLEDSTKIKTYAVQISEIEKNYSGEKLAKLLTISDSLYKKCPSKIEHEKRMKELEAESKEYFESLSKELYSDEMSKLEKETKKNIEDVESYSTPYNGLDGLEVPKF